MAVEAAEWITLKQASDMLAVPPSTLRRWADAGRIPVRRTPGGHRRFNAAAVRALAPRIPTRLASSAMTWTETSAQAIERQAWHAHFAAGPMVEQMRGLGQRLLGLLIQYLVWQGDDDRFLNDGRAVGADYGAIVHSAGISLRDTVQAFFYFRHTFWRTALRIPGGSQESDATEVIRISERIDTFMNEVLLSTLTAYE